MEDIKQANHKTFYEGENLLLEISGILDVTSTPKIWKETSKIIQESKFKKLVIQANGIHDCEGVGIALLFHYKKMAKKWQKQINLIAPSTVGSAWSRHVADSLQLLPPNGLRCKKV